MISCSSAVLSFLFSFLEDAAACFRHLFKKKNTQPRHLRHVLQKNQGSVFWNMSYSETRGGVFCRVFKCLFSLKKTQAHVLPFILPWFIFLFQTKIRDHALEGVYCLLCTPSYSSFWLCLCFRLKGIAQISSDTKSKKNNRCIYDFIQIFMKFCVHTQKSSFLVYLNSVF